MSTGGARAPRCQRAVMGVGDTPHALGAAPWVGGVPGRPPPPPALRVALWGALGSGCHARRAAPSRSQRPRWAVPCRAAGLQPHGAVGLGAWLPFPLAGAVKEALCARPLPWPVRPPGSPA